MPFSETISYQHLSFLRKEWGGHSFPQWLEGWLTAVILLYSMYFFIYVLTNASAVVNIFPSYHDLYFWSQVSNLSSRTVSVTRREILTFSMMNIHTDSVQHSVTDYSYLILSLGMYWIYSLWHNYRLWHFYINVSKFHVHEAFSFLKVIMINFSQLNNSWFNNTVSFMYKNNF